ncbi:MAG: NAD(P)-dependent alcohol dehydrogenase [Candidatus Eisenbacteria bacterium]
MIPSRGYAALHSKAPLTAHTFQRRDPGPHDVVIDIHFCGICHSDIHQARNEWDTSTFPMVPGHEIAGVVARVGTAVTRFRVGDRVGVGCMVNSCRTCEECREDLEQFCPNPVWTYNGLESDGVTPTMGGYANNNVVDEAFVLRIPDALPLDTAAPLLCAGITTYSPLRHWNAGPGKRVAVIGLGGLGHMAVKLAHAMGAETSVLSHSARKRDDALRLGADRFYDTSHPDTLVSLERTFDLILNTVSADVDWNPYLATLRRDGTMVLVGLPEQPLAIDAFSLVGGRRRIAGSPIGGIAETQEMLDFCAKHDIVCDIERVAIADVNRAYERVLASDVHYRFVIDMATLA